MKLQGQSAGTPKKQARLYQLFRCSLQTSKAPKIRDFIFWLFDGNAGCGINYKAGCKGSPLTFLDAAEKSRRKWFGMFCEKESERCAELEDHLQMRFSAGHWPEDCSWTVSCKDNAIGLVEFQRRIEASGEKPEFAHGIVFIDSEGFPGGIPIRQLPEFLARFPRIDLIFNVNISVFAMVQAARASNNPKIPNKEKFQKWPVQKFADLPTYLDPARKRRWYCFLPSKRGENMHFVLFYAFSGGKRQLPKKLLPLNHPAVQRLFIKCFPGDPDQTYIWPDLYNLGEDHAKQ
jgi:hypothetical protein